MTSETKAPVKNQDDVSEIENDEQGIWLESDMEPDDLKAIEILARRGYKFAHAWLPEGSASTKVERFKEGSKLLAKEGLNIGNPMIHQGLGTERTWPGDGKEYPNLKVDLKQDEKPRKLIIQEYQYYLTRYLTKCKNPKMVILSPIRLLMEAWHATTVYNPSEPWKDTIPAVRFNSLNYDIFEKYSSPSPLKNEETKEIKETEEAKEKGEPRESKEGEKTQRRASVAGEIEMETEPIITHEIVKWCPNLRNQKDFDLDAFNKPFDRKLLDRATLFLYGSFNLRCVYRQEYERCYKFVLSRCPTDQIPKARPKLMHELDIQQLSWHYIAKCIESFKQANIFETFPVLGENNNVSIENPEGQALFNKFVRQSKQESKLMFEPDTTCQDKANFIANVEHTGVTASDSYLSMFLRSTKLWNEYLMQDCIIDAHKALEIPDDSSSIWESLVNEPSSISIEQIRGKYTPNWKFDDPRLAKFWRNYKTYRQIKPNATFQFVLADIGLAIVMENADYVESIKQGYFHITEAGYTGYLTLALNSSRRMVNYYTGDGTNTKSKLLSDM